MSKGEFDFESLNEFHDSVNSLLSSPGMKLEICDLGQEKLAHDVSEASLKMADSCAAAKDLLLLAKDHLQSLQSAFRRIAGAADRAAGDTIAPHRVPRKQLKKAIMKRLDSLKGMKSNFSSPAAAAAEEEERSLVVVVRLLKEVRATTTAIVRSLLTLIAIPHPGAGRGGKADPGRRDPIFRIKLTRVDSLSFWERCDVSDVRTMMKRLEEVEMVVDDMGAELEDMFRKLIRTRASLLNIITG